MFSNLILFYLCASMIFIFRLLSDDFVDNIRIPLSSIEPILVGGHRSHDNVIFVKLCR